MEEFVLSFYQVGSGDGLMVSGLAAIHYSPRDATGRERRRVSKTFDSQARAPLLPLVPGRMDMLCLCSPQAVRIKNPRWAGVGGGRMRVCQEELGLAQPGVGTR